jgi:hypothetical protein
MERGEEFRSSGVQEFRSSGVQEFRSSGVQEFRSSGVQEPGVLRYKERRKASHSLESFSWSFSVSFEEPRQRTRTSTIEGFPALES